MNRAERKARRLDRRIADNESGRQAARAARLSAWAIGLALIIGIVVAMMWHR